MHANDETTRRRFLEGSTGAGAGHIALSALGASPFARVLGANDRVQIGVIGTGGRAMQLMDHLIAKPKDAIQGGIKQWKTKPVGGADLIAVAGRLRASSQPGRRQGRPQHGQVRRLPQDAGSKRGPGRDHRGPRPLAQADAH